MNRQVHILFLPLMAHGHILPMINMANLFISRGLRATIISTPTFAQRARDSGADIGLVIIRFPPPQSKLPHHIVSFDQLTSDELLIEAHDALHLLQEPVERLIQELHPDCLVSDLFFPWSADSAAKFGVPRLIFHGMSYFALCASMQMRRHKPFNKVSSDSEPFLVPNLPHDIRFLRTQVPEFVVEENETPLAKLMPRIVESVSRSYGVVINSFYELEPDYADHYRKVLGVRAWNIGPLLLCNSGRKGSSAAHECLAWLDSKKPMSVVYACFGSLATFATAQLQEIARGLETSGHDFVWAVRDGSDQEWLPDGFLERISQRGMIIRGWAPQLEILDHPATGAFMTHCGWNSTLEGICAGVPMVTWPLFAEQFYNEKLVTEVLRIGVPVGNLKWAQLGVEGVAAEAVARALAAVMVGVEMRKRAWWYKEMARKAVGEGGSSSNDLNRLIHDLCLYQCQE